MVVVVEGGFFGGWKWVDIARCPHIHIFVLANIILAYSERDIVRLFAHLKRKRVGLMNK